jgi:DHA2 family methylenomycin A resistance protein-like MFS transporter
MNNRGLVALCLGFFMVIMDATIVNVALPSISHSLHANVSWLQWIVAGYTLSFACFLITAGHLGDQFGEKKIFLSGVLCFVLFSLLCGLAGSPLSLTIFRVLQGLSAAFIVPASLALLHALYEDPAARARAMGIWGAVGGVAAAMGPILGAALTTCFSWRAVFVVNVPIGLVCCFMTLSAIKKTVLKDSVPFDWCGQLFIVLFIAALAFGLIESGKFGWSSYYVWISLAVAALSLVLFIIAEALSKHPMIPLSIFNNRSYSVGNIVGLAMNIAFYGELFILPLYFQHMRDYTVMQTGLALIPLVAMVAISSYYSGKVASTRGVKLPMLVGLFAGAIGFVCLWFVVSHQLSYVAFIMPFLLIGFGIAFTMPASTLCVMQSIASDKKGIAAGTYNTGRQVGSLLGVALFGTLIASRIHFILGVSLSLWIAAAIYCISGLLVACLVQKNMG